MLLQFLGSMVPNTHHIGGNHFAEIMTGLVSADGLLYIEQNPNGITVERPRGQPFIELVLLTLRSWKTGALKLAGIEVRIMVIQGERGPVIDASPRHDP